MPKFRLMLSAAPAILACTFAAPGFAQDTATPQAAQADEGNAGDIIVTATRRSEALSDIPLAVSAVTAASLQNSGASDIRALNQLSPSLLVSSTSSEAGAGGARIRGIGTVGDNPGLESSVATFIDGVYRSRAGVGLTELGTIDRIEVLRGPQGTLFGRNASAGLISIITAKPQSTFGATAELTYGNYETYRGVGSITGPITESVSARLDGVYYKRKGFLTDTISGRTLNNRDRYLLRGQILFEPTSDFSVRLIGDYAERNEECCGAVYQRAQTVSSSTPGVGGGALIFSPSGIATLERALGAQIIDNPSLRRTAITPGRSYRSDVRDWGVSGEINYKFGDAQLTSITAYRDFRFIRGQDADYNNLDLFYRPDDGSGFTRFKTFTQELRLQGSAFGERLDWLVGGYYADEKLTLADNISLGSQIDPFATQLIRASSPALATFPGFTNLRAFVTGALAFQGLPAPASNPITSLVPLGIDLTASTTRDQFNQGSRNYAVFTHNIIKLTDNVSLTLGARYTNERKSLDAKLQSGSQCSTYQGGIVGLRTFAANPANAALAAAATGVANTLTALAALPCAINSANGSFSGGRRSEDEITGTAVLSFKPADGLLSYLSYSRGYKAGGFNLDRAGLNPANVNLNALQFEAEKVNAYELGVKYNGRGIDLNVALFRQDFANFQLNTFNGINFIVENIASCSASLNGADSDASNAAVTCTGSRKPGVRSEGVEVEAFLRPARDVAVNLGFTYADTKYRNNLIGATGNAIASALFQLPGSRLSNSSQYVVTGSSTWTPPLGSGGLSGLLYADFRYMSDVNTGSDKDVEKIQDGFVVVNARIGLRGAQQRWALELFAQNVFDTVYRQVGFDAPLQGSGTTGATRAFGSTSTQLFAQFLAEPRTYGVTARFKF